MCCNDGKSCCERKFLTLENLSFKQSKLPISSFQINKYNETLNFTKTENHEDQSIKNFEKNVIEKILEFIQGLLNRLKRIFIKGNLPIEEHKNVDDYLNLNENNNNLNLSYLSDNNNFFEYIRNEISNFFKDKINDSINKIEDIMNIIKYNFSKEKENEKLLDFIISVVNKLIE